MDIFEPIEWVNYWKENNQIEQRMLIIGDSVARQFRKTLKKLLQDRFAIDLIATSYYPGLKRCLKVIEDFFYDNMEYEYIVFNLGAHHGYSYSIYSNKKDEQIFTENIAEIFKFLKKKCGKLIVLSGTPENILYKENNVEIQKRNEIIQRMCRENRDLYIDIYEQMEGTNYEYVDAWCHFREDGDCNIVQAILSDIVGEIPKINMIVSLKEFKKELENVSNIYIYGNGKRGKALKKYLAVEGITIDGVIVSFDYMSEDEKVISLDQVEQDATVVVTPMDIDIIRQLNERGLKHFFLADEVYKFIYVYNEMFLG